MKLFGKDNICVDWWILYSMLCLKRWKIGCVSKGGNRKEGLTGAVKKIKKYWAYMYLTDISVVVRYIVYLTAFRYTSGERYEY